MDVDDDLGQLEWREILQLRFSRANAIAGVVSVALAPFVLPNIDWARFWPALLVFGLVAAGLVGAAFWSRLHTGTLAISTVAFDLLTGTAGIHGQGWTPAPTIVLTIAVLAAAVLFGRRGAFVAIGGTVAVFVVTGYAMSRGLAPIPHGQPLMGDLAAWARVTILCAGAWSLVGWLASYTVQTIEASVGSEQQARSALAREKVERVAIEQSRDDAKAAFVAAQRKETVAALAGGLAHDFNNTLMVIMSWAELLQAELSESSAGGGSTEGTEKGTKRETGGGEDELLVEATGAVVTASEQASFLARQLLSLGRRGHSTPEPVDLPGVMALAVTSLRKLLPPNIEVKLETEAVDVVLAEPAQLQQVILNLAINARDAMPEGGTLTFQVWQERDSNDRSWVAFSVADTGTGMDAETRARIFEPFFTTKAAGKGSGLGLASVTAIVHQLQGHLEVESAVGEGTRFEIQLRARPALREAKGMSSVEVIPVDGGRALLVENEPQVRAFIGRTLEGMGLQVLEAVDGDEAMVRIEALARKGESVELLCTDGVMPGVRPADFIERARLKLPDCRVLVCSGHLPDDRMRREIARGHLAFLPKPFAGDELRRHVSGLLNSEQRELQEFNRLRKLSDESRERQ